MNYSELTEDVIKIVLNVGEFIRKHLNFISSDNIEKKGYNNFVTYVDKGAEEQLVNGLIKLLPEAGFIVEEETICKKGKNYNWIIDPLDGTTNFIHRVPCFSISVALTEGNEIVIGVIYEINNNECFYAWKGSKAFLNKNEINVSNINSLDNSLLATGFPYNDFGRLENYMNILKEFMLNTHGIRRLGSAAVDLAYVACGRFDGFYEYGLNPWDVAAGAFIVQQAGGKVSDFDGGNNFIFGREIIASNYYIHEEMIQVIKKFI